MASRVLAGALGGVGQGLDKFFENLWRKQEWKREEERREEEKERRDRFDQLMRDRLKLQEKTGAAQTAYFEAGTKERGAAYERGETAYKRELALQLPLEEEAKLRRRERRVGIKTKRGTLAVQQAQIGASESATKLNQLRIEQEELTRIVDSIGDPEFAAAFYNDAKQLPGYNPLWYDRQTVEMMMQALRMNRDDPVAKRFFDSKNQFEQDVPQLFEKHRPRVLELRRLYAEDPEGLKEFAAIQREQIINDPNTPPEVVEELSEIDRQEAFEEAFAVPSAIAEFAAPVTAFVKKRQGEFAAPPSRVGSRLEAIESGNMRNPTLLRDFLGMGGGAKKMGFPLSAITGREKAPLTGWERFRSGQMR